LAAAAAVMNFFMNRRCLRLVRLSVLCVCLGAAGSVSSAENSPVRFHQDWLAARRGESGVVHHREPPAGNVLPDFEDPRSILRHVLSAAPVEPVVHPSERYYYYEFPLGDRVVSGNIRFTEAEVGEVSVGYFDRLDRSAMRWATFGRGGELALDGHGPGSGVVSVAMDRELGKVTVAFTDEQGSGSLSRTFTLDQSAFGNEADAGLLPGERYVSGVLDESGFYFHLIYSELHRAFYYTLQSNRRHADSLHEIAASGIGVEAATPEDLMLLVGGESRFVFLRDAALGRTILVGVSKGAIAANSYYDGPFDQVPPHLPLRPMLTDAYPYVAYGGGIDEHGRFLDRVGQRVAISPYHDYADLDEMRDWIRETIDSRAEGTARWIRVVLEEKRLFHLRLSGSRDQAEEFRHDVRKSAAWPAGHWLQQSNAASDSSTAND
jgi:hypothetical protein